jgi:leucyl aminopeptidase
VSGRTRAPGFFRARAEEGPCVAAPLTSPSLALVSAVPGGMGDLEGADAVAVPVEPVTDGGGVRLDLSSVQLAERYGMDPTVLLEREKAKGEPGEVTTATVARADSPVRRILFVGVGDGSVLALRRAGAALARRARGTKRLVVSVVESAGPEDLRAFAEGLLLGSYAFHRRSSPKSPAPLESAVLVVETPDGMRDALDRAVVTGTAVWRARDLANTPSDVKSPDWLAERARQLGEDSGLEVWVRDAGWLAARGFGGLLAVGGGSAQPPRLIELSYAPEGPSPADGHVVLVGKGITFDTGGLSLKPRESMTTMKTDMSGGAAVIAAMAALRQLGVRVWVTGLVAAAENMPSGSAYRPGDVVTHYGGKTVEVFNTDAEGRMVLADALAYACAELDPTVLVDLATLTGAASLGLGRRHAAMFATGDALAEALEAAGAATGERLWRMPLLEDYRSALDSQIADLAHISRDPVLRGEAITAALFLREFTAGRPWAHLDIAGPARADSEEHEVSKGGTGFGTRTLLRWLESF